MIIEKLRILKIHRKDSFGTLIKFLENNGENLEEFEYYSCNELLNLAIAKFCLKLKFLHEVRDINSNLQ